MNPLLNAEMSNARTADIARNLKHAHRIPAAPRSGARPAGSRGILRMFSSLRPLRHAA